MRDPKRINRIVELVRLAWMLYPDMRLGQLIEAALSMSGYKGDVFNIEEEDLERGLRAILNREA